jgi:hypothetical protein
MTDVSKTFRGGVMTGAMRFRARGWMVSIVTILVSCSTGQGVPFRQKTEAGSGDREPTEIGMVALLASPERYDGKFIRTIGFMCIEFEGNALYLHEEDFRHGIRKNSLALHLSESQRKQFKGLSLKYVLIEGKVAASAVERADMWAGGIENVTRLEVWPADRGVIPHQ